ncbi:hypothetical protein pb186bvf_010582 [Paramecium bursaria]
MKYQSIPNDIRTAFIKRVQEKACTIRQAAKEFGLKFSTSKAILQTYRKEGRIGKKKNRNRNTKAEKIEESLKIEVNSEKPVVNDQPNLPSSILPTQRIFDENPLISVIKIQQELMQQKQLYIHLLSMMMLQKKQ